MGTDGSFSEQNHSAAASDVPQSQAPPFLVAGVGASAGGLEALSRLLQATPKQTPLALVLVQHLARAHESLLPELLQKKTSMKVLEARDDMAIEPGHVYVIPPDARMTVLDGKLRVRPRPREGHDAPIDHLFESLAEQYRERAVGVVLSGAGHDGASGLARIKAAGGVTLVQEPRDAQVDGMPRAALATGAVDLVLLVDGIARELGRLAQHPFFQQSFPVASEEPAVADDDDANMRVLFQLLRRATGVDFAHYKLPTIQRRVQRRLALHHLNDLTEYLRYMQVNSGEIEQLHDDILIHVTGFFREPESFEALQQEVLPGLVKERSASDPIRAWVPGCSSGEEAYSLAMVLLEAMDEHSGAPIQLFATDVSQRMVTRARAGLYPESIATEVSPERLRRFFDKQDDSYRIKAFLRESCVFARQDVTRDPPFSKLDLVLCRNLLIYLGQSLQRKAITVFHYALKPSGVLMLGRSETIGAQADLFTTVDNRWKIYKRKPGVLPPRELDFMPRLPPQTESVVPAAARFAARIGREWDVQSEANQLLLERFAPPMVIVDDASHVVRSRGRTSRYLELPSGEVSLDVLRMARPGLLAPLRAALNEARAGNAPVRKQGLELGTGDDLRLVNLEITPIGEPERRHYMILFEEARTNATPEGTAEAVRANGDETSRQLIQQLQYELSDTRLHLQSIIQDMEAANEELQSANEEILSSNEELQSTNEELDTAREELQSTNEELGTVNDELQGRNTELASANSDLQNLLASAQIPIVIISSDLTIRRFTPAAERMLNLIKSDIGRPIGHIKPNIRCPELEELIREVIEAVSIVEREVADHEGGSHVLTLRPYKTTENRIEGAVLALFPVSATLKLAIETGEAIMSTVQDPILLLDGGQRVQRVNRAFCEKFRVSVADTEGRSVYELGGGQWNIPALRRLLEQVLPERKNFESFSVEHDFPGIGHKKMLVDAKRIESGKGGSGVILLIIRDVSE